MVSLKYIKQEKGKTVASISNDITQAEKMLAWDKLVTGSLEATSTLIWVSSVEAEQDMGCESSLDHHLLEVSEMWEYPHPNSSLIASAQGQGCIHRCRMATIIERWYAQCISLDDTLILLQYNPLGLALPAYRLQIGVGQEDVVLWIQGVVGQPVCIYITSCFNGNSLKKLTAPMPINTILTWDVIHTHNEPRGLKTNTESMEHTPGMHSGSEPQGETIHGLDFSTLTIRSSQGDCLP